MSDDSPVDSVTTPPKSRRLRRWLSVMAGILLLPVILLATAWFAVPPDVLREHARWGRDADSEFVTEEGPPPASGIRFQAQAGKLESSDSMISSCASSSGDRSRAACRTVAVLNRSDDLFMLRLGQELAEAIKKFPLVDRIDYYPASSSPQHGELAPDVVISLELKQFQESGPPWARKIEALVHATAGSRIASSSSYYHDSLTPPVLDYFWVGRLQHRSTSKGVTSSAAKYKQVAESCAKQISGALRKQFDEDLKKYGPLPKLPAGFYPAYREPQGISFGNDLPFECLASWHGLMNRCDATWRLSTDRQPGEVLAALRSRMEAAAWKSSDAPSSGPLTRVRLTRGPTVLEIFPESASMLSDSSPMPGAGDSAAQSPPQRTVYVHYLDRMSQDEVAAAVDRAIADKAPIDLLSLFEQAWTPAQCGRIVAKFESRPRMDAEGWLTLARLYNRPRATAQGKGRRRQGPCAPAGGGRHRQLVHTRRRDGQVPRGRVLGQNVRPMPGCSSNWASSRSSPALRSPTKRWPGKNQRTIW